MSEEDPFHLARATALNTFADLEYFLAMLFHKLLGADEKKSYIVFSETKSSYSRGELLKQLMKETYGDEYKEFFKTLMEQLATVTGTRNKVVHWIVLTSKRGKPVDPETDVNLHEHPNIYAERTLSKKDIEAFTKHADFLRRLVHSFVDYLNAGSKMDPEWREVFQQKVVYPPPKDHPALRMFEGTERYTAFDTL